MDGRQEDKAKEIASDFLELVEKIDYNKYFENMGTVTGAKAGGFLRTSTRPTSKRRNVLLLLRASVRAFTHKVSRAPISVECLL